MGVAADQPRALTRKIAEETRDNLNRSSHKSAVGLLGVRIVYHLTLHQCGKGAKYCVRDWIEKNRITEEYVFPACEAAGIERKHPDVERIDPSKPIMSWRSAWRAALSRAALQLRFHDLRHTCITKMAEGQASEQTLMSIAGHLSRKMVEHYSHIRMTAKRAALDAIVTPAFDGAVAQNWAQSSSVGKDSTAN